MDQHFNLEYFTAFNTNEFELCVSYVLVRQTHTYWKYFINAKFIRGRKSLPSECLILASAIITNHVKSVERLGITFGAEAYPKMMKLIQEGYLKLKMSQSDFEKNYFIGARHSQQKLGHA